MGATGAFAPVHFGQRLHATIDFQTKYFLDSAFVSLFPIAIQISIKTIDLYPSIEIYYKVPNSCHAGSTEGKKVKEGLL